MNPTYNIISIDLEIHPQTHKLLKAGVYCLKTGKTFFISHKKPDSYVLLDEFCRDADLIIGHNITWHDLLFLRKNAPHLKLCSIPFADTLVLSPLAFPAHPYHHLLKGYKLVKQAVNDPVEDAKLASVLFCDAYESFAALEPELAGLYGRLLSLAFPDSAYSIFFQSLPGVILPEQNQIIPLWLKYSKGLVCQTKAEEIVRELAYNYTGEHTPRTRQATICESAAVLAFMLAWLRVAGGKSVVSAWVRYKYPEITEYLDELRAKPCYKYACSYCQKNFNLKANLKRFFGYDSFLPVKDENPPLQEEIVRAIVQGHDCLAVLPTGAGKSLCYQLPALMKAQQRNQLTLIISPLQSLMKDQVDNLAAKGILNAGTINSLLTLVERRKVLEGIRMGDIDLVWLAPEQLRNTTVKNTLKQRELALVVIDEAHCFSKWGHDFRPDYLFLARFLREICNSDHEAPAKLPQIACFTATAKKEVKEEIITYFARETGKTLKLFEAGHERDNLRFELLEVRSKDKIHTIEQILTDILGPCKEPSPKTSENNDENISYRSTGGAIVFAATRTDTQKISNSLAASGWSCDYFHAGRTPEEKKQIQERFIRGDLQVIVATNAFGMGVDKPDVRVVIHAHVPGSLENYLQEAGRAGRDRKPAFCFLLYDPDDLETQFEMTARSELNWRDISAMFTGLKKLTARAKDRTIVATSGELLCAEEVSPYLDELSAEDTLYDTKVKTALALLEKSGKLIRGDNRTQVIQGRVLVKNKKEADAKIATLNLSQKEQAIWKHLLDILLQAGPKDLLNTDFLSLETGLEPRRILEILASMRNAGIVSHDLNMTAYVRKGIADDSLSRWQNYQQLEKSLLNLMEEDEPDSEPDTTYVFHLRYMTQRLKDAGLVQATPHKVLLVLELLLQENLIRVRNKNPEEYNLILQKNWADIRRFVLNRSLVCKVLLDFLLTRLEPTTRGKDLLVSFQSGQATTALQHNLTTAHFKDHNKWLEIGLLTLDRTGSICLQNGLAVFRPAMTIKVTSDQNERFTAKEFKSLKTYYQERVAQIHVMDKYAAKARETIKQAIILVREYFHLDRKSFYQRYFKGKQHLLGLPTAEKTLHEILSPSPPLNEVQKQAVTSPLNSNLLLVAGPGSGKTRTIVHRIAYLVKVKRVLPWQIMALAFNRNAVTQLKLRLRKLIGSAGARVRVHTYHSLAMSLTGRSFLGQSLTPVQKETKLFDNILQEAIELLQAHSQNNREFNNTVISWRDKLLNGIKFILVDEYQDINRLEYTLLSLLAGRSEKESDTKPALMAVGDADQNIYAWQGSNTIYIRKFRQDYNAKILFMVQNYRSTPAIIEIARRLISHNKDRMDCPAIQSARSVSDLMQPVTLITTPDRAGLFKAVLLQAQKLQSTANNNLCILCRTHREMDSILVMAKKMGMTINCLRQSIYTKIPLPKVREFHILLNSLNECRGQRINGHKLKELIEGLITDSGFKPDNFWLTQFKAILKNYLVEIGEGNYSIYNFIQFVYDAAREPVRFADEKGIFMSTMHTAKGLEFDTVLVAGTPQNSSEEERRLYYVAITRAKNQLFCFESAQNPNPFFREMSKNADNNDKYCQHIQMAPDLSPAEIKAASTCIFETGLDDIVISFPAYKTIYPAAQKIIQSLEPGHFHLLELKEITTSSDKKQFRFYYNKRPIARLSQRGGNKFLKLLNQGYRIKKVIFLAAVKVSKSERTAEDYHGVLDNWFTPLFQVLLEKM